MGENEPRSEYENEIPTKIINFVHVQNKIWRRKKRERKKKIEVLKFKYTGMF